MQPFRPSPVFRLRPSAPGGEAPRSHPKEAHPPSVVAQVRALVETTFLTFRDIQARTGVNNGTISRWANANDWQRPSRAWRARPRRDKLPKAPRGRELARRIYVEAERLLVEVTSAPKVDPAALSEALRLLREARDVQRVFRGTRAPPSPEIADGRKARRNARLKAKRAALKEERALLGKRPTKRDRHHAWMLRKIDE